MAHTFGLELEFGSGVADLAALIRERGLAGDRKIHKYHCTCPSCDFNSPYAFRFQTDRSCDGEAITKIYSSDTDLNDGHLFIDNMTALQQAAIEADAEPDMRSGLHVHVHPGRIGTLRRSNSFLAFLLWEPAIHSLSQGRFNAPRGANMTVTKSLLGQLHHATGKEPPPRTHEETVFSPYINYRDSMKILLGYYPDLLQYHSGADRHSNLNLGSRHGTWEHRWPNSTRSAWRMEMFARVSIAMFHPNTTDGMLSDFTETKDVGAELPRRTLKDDAPDFFDMSGPQRIQRLQTYIARSDPRAAELMEKQISYTTQYAETPIPELTTA